MQVVPQRALRQPAQALPVGWELPVEAQVRREQPPFLQLAAALLSGEQETVEPGLRGVQGRELVRVPQAAAEIRAFPRAAPPAPAQNQAELALVASASDLASSADLAFQAFAAPALEIREQSSPVASDRPASAAAWVVAEKAQNQAETTGASSALASLAVAQVPEQVSSPPANL